MNGIFKLKEPATMHKPNVLFLCTGNSARSQMAEALLRHHAGDRFKAFSAGLDPKGMNPLTTRVMGEIGLNLDEQWSKGVKEYLGRIAVHYLIIVCSDAEDRCPHVWPGMRQRLFWRFDDPAAATGTEDERLAEFRRVRDEIDHRIKTWLAELALSEREVRSADS